MQPIICLMGPTAAGKTELSLQLARDLEAEIVSVDSVMVYRSMSVGSAKPSYEQRSKVAHHLIDVCDPATPYSAAQFQQQAVKCIDEIRTRNKRVLLVGGTMLYYKALQQGLAWLPSADVQIRNLIDEEAQRVGWEAMHEQLAFIDPASAARIHPTDTQRIQRALEVYRVTGRSLSQLWQDTTTKAPASLTFVNLGLYPHDRERLHQRINQRFLQMLDEGFLEEVQHLCSRGDLHINLPALRSVGYRQAWQYLHHKISYQEMIDHAMAATRQLAKRQFTWLKQWPQITYFDSFCPHIYSKLLDTILKLPQFQGR